MSYRRWEHITHLSDLSFRLVGRSKEVRARGHGPCMTLRLLTETRAVKTISPEALQWTIRGLFAPTVASLAAECTKSRRLGADIYRQTAIALAGVAACRHIASSSNRRKLFLASQARPMADATTRGLSSCYASVTAASISSSWRAATCETSYSSVEVPGSGRVPRPGQRETVKMSVFLCQNN
jgi:hypothetical protein